MKIDTSSRHYRWGEWWQQVPWLDENFRQPQSLCSYFWKWLIGSPIAAILSGLLVVVIAVGVAAIALAIEVGPLLFGIEAMLDPPAWRTGEDGVIRLIWIIPQWMPYALWLLQSIIWAITYMVLTKRRIPRKAADTLDVVGGALMSAKRGVCPLVEYVYVTGRDAT